MGFSGSGFIFHLEVFATHFEITGLRRSRKLDMSHFSTLRSKLTDTETLKVALQDLGIKVKTNAEVRGLCNQTIKADIVAVLDGDCDLGWQRNSDGSLAVIADLWGVATKHNLANLMDVVNQKYAINKTLEAVKRPGLQNANVKLSLQNHLTA
jgi:hypothetical protein